MVEKKIPASNLPLRSMGSTLYIGSSASKIWIQRVFYESEGHAKAWPSTSSRRGVGALNTSAKLLGRTIDIDTNNHFLSRTLTGSG